MMISTRGRYALRILVDLAENQHEGYITLKEAADRQEISEKYLESIIKDLVRGGFVTGVRGKGGGYRKRAASPAPVRPRAGHSPCGKGWTRSSANTSAALP